MKTEQIGYDVPERFIYVGKNGGYRVFANEDDTQYVIEIDGGSCWVLVPGDEAWSDLEDLIGLFLESDE